jgi:hypothetical protein
MRGEDELTVKVFGFSMGSAGNAEFGAVGRVGGTGGDDEGIAELDETLPEIIDKILEKRIGELLDCPAEELVEEMAETEPLIEEAGFELVEARLLELQTLLVAELVNETDRD